jgi:N-acetylmuramic acid 6-phosphate etherase
MLDDLRTEQKLAAASHVDSMTTLEAVTLMNAADAEIAAAVAVELPRIARAIDAIVAILDQGGRLAYIGAGTSGRLGVLDASECPPTFGVPADLVRGIMAGGERALSRASETSEDDRDAGSADLVAAGFSSRDALVGVSASGRTPYVLGAVRKAREMGAVTAGVSCSPDSELSRNVDYPIEVVPGPEVIAGSTRLRAGTATKMVLNMISTVAMVRLGYVLGNRMVNVQPTNAKLEDRARRIIADAAGVSYERASELLDQAGRSVPVAIVMERKQVTREEAERLLAASRGRIGAILK